MSTPSAPGALRASHRILRILINLNWILGVLILALLVDSLIAERFVMRALGVSRYAGASSRMVDMRLIMVLGIVAVPITHVVLTRLLAIVNTVRAGDPFVAENAARLRQIAWAVVALEGVHLLIVGVARSSVASSAPLDFGSSISMARWLTVLLLFVLARVFETGARMREELEGTV